MKLSRNQLVLAMLFALLLGLIITVGARCGASGTSATRTVTPTRSAATTRTPSVTARTSPTTTTGISGTVTGRATDVPIAPPGSQTAPTPTPITVGPLPVLTPLAQPTLTTSTTGTTGTTGTTTTTGNSNLPATNPVPTTTGGSTPSGAGTIYIVKAGDTLGGIAKQFGVSSTSIMQENNISDASRIYIGQRLRIPGSVPLSAASSTATATAGTVYVVQPGDTLGRIAAKYGVTVAAIVKANNLKNSNVIYSGQKLTIPPKP